MSAMEHTLTFCCKKSSKKMLNYDQPWYILKMKIAAQYVFEIYWGSYAEDAAMRI